MYNYLFRKFHPGRWATAPTCSMAEGMVDNLDIAKNVFGIHGIDDAGEAVAARSLSRRQVLAFFASAKGGAERHRPIIDCEHFHGFGQ